MVLLSLFRQQRSKRYVAGWVSRAGNENSVMAVETSRYLQSSGNPMSTTLVTREAWRAIRRNKMRSALTVLGISIGIAAVICVFGIGDAGKAQLDDAFNSLGENLIWVEAGGRTVNGVRTGSGGTKTLTVGDANAILKEIPLIRKVSPQVDGNVQVVYGNLNWGTGYRGESPEYVEMQALGNRVGGEHLAG